MRAADIAVPTANTVIVGNYGAQIYKTTSDYTPSSTNVRFVHSSNGLPAQGINQLARDTHVSPNVYAATDGAGVFKSTNLGATWSDSNGTGLTALACAYIGDIETTEADPVRIYASSNCGSPTGVFRSTDGGATWSPPLTGAGPGQMPVGTTIVSVNVDPTNADVVYASGATTGVWKSTDAGNTWAQINSGLSAGLFGGNIRPTRVRINFTTPSTLYVGVRGGGVFISTNGGTTWSAQNTGLPTSEVTNINVSRVDANIIYAVFGLDGIYKGVNTAGTISWSLLTNSLPGPTFVNSPLADPTTLYVGTFAGFFRSTDGGTTWLELKDGLGPSDTNAVKSDPVSSNIVYATTFEALYRSTDGGVTWTRKPVAGATPRSGLESQIAIDPTTPSTIYVATFNDGIFKSVNSGDTFSPINTGLVSNLMSADATIALSPSSPSTLWAGFFDALGINAGLYKSINGGTSWSNLTSHLPNPASQRIRSIYPDPANANHVWVLTGDGPYQTIDGGTTFALGGPGTNFGSGRGMAFDPGDASAIWLGRFSSDALGNPSATTSGVFKSGDAGVSYTRKLGSALVEHVGLSRNGGNTSVFAATWPDDVLRLERSNDGGTTWFNDSVGLVSPALRSFDFGAAQTAIRFMAGNGVGVARKSFLPYGPDYDRSGRADLFWRNSIDGSNVQWFMDGPNLMSFAFQPTVPLGVGWAVVAQADFDGDGKTDILWRNETTGANLIWFMDGATLVSAQSITSVPPGAGWFVAGVGDFNGDGKADIFWRNTSNGWNSIWLMNGATLISGTFVPTVPTSYSVVGVGDINGDGRADVFWYDSATGFTASWLMNGASIDTLTFYVTVPPSSGWSVVGVGDFNGDGNADLLWRNSIDGNNLIWFMNGTSLASSAFIPNVDPSSGWVPVSVADFNGDGIADIFWRNSTSGLNTIWFMSGATLVSSAFQPTVPPATGWEVQKQ
ncbi:MAG TPA: FG-GAP-like repeat-containing protein [Casimicrobiaceae bacterium]|nr:FG-GAP-like repeat-containing protein [Casimicrobiaceae bacterium]